MRPPPSPLPQRIAAVATAIGLLFATSDARAWLLHEHAHIGRAALATAPLIPLGTEDEAKVLRADTEVLQVAWTRSAPKERTLGAMTGPPPPWGERLCTTVTSPDDLDNLVPVGYLACGDSLGAKRWLIQAADRGLWGLERLHAVGDNGTFQIVLGREAGFRYLWGTGLGNNAWTVEVPLFEYKPRSWYAGSISNSFGAQLGFTLDNTELTSQRLPDGTLLGAFLRIDGGTRIFSYP